MECLLRARWEGNVRELENVIVRGIMFSPEHEIRPEDAGFHDPGRGVCSAVPLSSENLSYRDAKEEALKCFHADYIGSLLSRTGGNVSQAARICGMERQALQQIMRRYGIRSDSFRSE